MPKSTVDNTSFGRDSVSTGSKSQKYTIHQFIRNRWRSKCEYSSSMMAASCTMYYLNAGIADGQVKDYNYFMMVLSYAILALPMYYMQVLLGQYTQMGIISLRYVAPIAHGLAIVFMLLLFLHTLNLSITFADVLTYFMNTFRTNLEWLTCEHKLQHKCWNNIPECNMTNCVNDDVMISAYLYYTYVYMEFKNTESMTTFGVPSLQRSILLAFFWITICLLSNFAGTCLRRMMTKIWVLTCVLLCINVLIVLARDGNTDVFVDTLVVNTTAITDIEAWCITLVEPILAMGLGKGIHALHGSYLDVGDTWEGTRILVTVYNVAAVSLNVFLGRACLYTIIKKAHMDDKHKPLIWYHGPVFYFATIPMALSLHRLPQIWNMLYFLTCLLLVTGNQFWHVHTLEKTICDAYPTTLKYSKYVSCLICILVTLISSLLSSKASYASTLVSSGDVLKFLELMVIFLFSIVVCYIYGVQKFCDDIHYMRGHEPAKYWKVTWYCAPPLLSIPVIYYYFYFKHKLLSFMCLLPIPLLALYETFRFIRKKNVIGLFRSDERYGPPDPKERYHRRLFNPRQETKLKRRSEFCNHRCLLHSKVLKQATLEEDAYKTGFFETRRLSDRENIED